MKHRHAVFGKYIALMTKLPTGADRSKSGRQYTPGIRTPILRGFNIPLLSLHYNASIFQVQK